MRRLRGVILEGEEIEGVILEGDEIEGGSSRPSEEIYGGHFGR